MQFTNTYVLVIAVTTRSCGPLAEVNLPLFMAPCPCSSLDGICRGRTAWGQVTLVWEVMELSQVLSTPSMSLECQGSPRGVDTKGLVTLPPRRPDWCFTETHFSILVRFSIPRAISTISFLWWRRTRVSRMWSCRCSTHQPGMCMIMVVSFIRRRSMC